MVQEAWRDLRRNPLPVYIYVIAMMAGAALFSAIDLGVTNLVDDEDPPAWMAIYHAGMQVAFAAYAALFQAGAFASLGKEIDKPLWKCEDAGMAVRRFFMPWFIINLLSYAALMAEVRAAQSESAGLLVTAEVLIMLMYMLAIPVGACVMFWGRFQWSELGEALSPLMTQIRIALVLPLVGLLGFFLHALYIEFLVRGYWTPVLGPALIQIPFATVELLQFAITWEIGRLHRNADDSSDSDPFDL